MTPEWLSNLWKTSDRSLKRVLALALIAAAIPFGIVIATQVWSARYIQNILDRFVTQDDLHEQTDTLAAQNAYVAEQVNAAIAVYNDSLLAYLGKERRLIQDTTLKPLVKLVFAMNDRLKDLEAAQSSTRSMVDDLPAAYEESLRRIVRDPATRDREMMRDLFRQELAPIKANVDSLMTIRARNLKKRF